MTAHDRFSSPLAERYASKAMLELWSPQTRHGLWRRLWLALAEAEQALGVPIPDEALAQMRAHLDDIDFEKVAVYERRFRHDVMAHVHAFGDVAPAAHKFIHLGATSAFVTDNADLIMMRRGIKGASSEMRPGSHNDSPGYTYEPARYYSRRTFYNWYSDGDREHAQMAADAFFDMMSGENRGKKKIAIRTTKTATRTIRNLEQMRTQKISRHLRHRNDLVDVARLD